VIAGGKENFFAKKFSFPPAPPYLSKNSCQNTLFDFASQTFQSVF
jgi:hypothetical protein